MQRYQWVDIAKGITMFLVVVGHVISGLHRNGKVEDSLFLTYCFDFLYTFHMPLFFILSGLFFERNLNKYTPKGMIEDKMKTILYPFVVWSVLQTLFEVLFSKYTNGQLTSDALLTCLFIPRGLFWFLYALFFMNVINSVLYWIFKKYGISVSMLISIVGYTASADVGVLSDTFKYLIFFNLGVVFANQLLDTKLFKGRMPRFAALGILLGTFILLEYFFLVQEVQSRFMLFALAILGSLTMIEISKMVKGRLADFWSRVGGKTMEIFTMHTFAASGMRIFLLNVFGISSIFIHATMGVLAGFFIPCLVSYIFSRYKFYPYLFSLKVKNK